MHGIPNTDYHPFEFYENLHLGTYRPISVYKAPFNESCLPCHQLSRFFPVGTTAIRFWISLKPRQRVILPSSGHHTHDASANSSLSVSRCACNQAKIRKARIQTDTSTPSAVFLLLQLPPDTINRNEIHGLQLVNRGANIT